MSDTLEQPDHLKHVPTVTAPSLGEILQWPTAPSRCVFCGGSCSPNDCVVVFTPITDCEHKNAEDGCCSHPKNMTPECHVAACPRLHRRIKI